MENCDQTFSRQNLHKGYQVKKLEQIQTHDISRSLV